MARFIDIDKWQEIFSSMSRHPLRTLLTAFSVWWGIFMLVILLGAGRGLENSAKKGFEDDAINSMWIWTQRTSQPYKGLPAGRSITFDNKDYDTVKELEGIDKVSGRRWIFGTYFITHGNKSLSFNTQPVHPEHIYVEKYKMTEGRNLNQTDIDKYRKVCVIGEPVRDAFFGKDTAAIGEYLNIKGVDYKIVGVFNETREREMQRIYVPVSTQQRIDGSDKLNTLVVTVNANSVEESEAIEDRIRTEMALHHKFSPTDREAIGIYNRYEDYQSFDKLFKMISLFIWFVGIGSIIAGVIGVSNIMLIVVKDRTREIGVRKALGATPFSIISMIVQESILLTSIAGYVGMASGLALVWGIEYFMEVNEIEAEFFYNPEVDMGMVIIAFLILVGSGFVSGLIPALQAVRIHPVIAMKS